MESPAPEPVVVTKHQVTTASGDGVEARFQALEQQQRMDHAYLEEWAKAMRVLHDTQQWERLRRIETEEQSVQMDMNLRCDLSVMRDQLDEKQKINTVSQVKAGLEHFFAHDLGNDLMKRLDLLQTAMETLQSQENKMQAYLTNFHGERPQEGQAIMAFIEAKVSQVREMVERLEVPGNTPVLHAFGPGSIPFTQVTKDTMGHIESLVQHHEVHIGELRGVQGGHEQRLGTVEARSLQLAENLQATSRASPEAQGLAGISLTAACAGRASGPAATQQGQRCSGGCGGQGSSGDGEQPPSVILQRVTGGNDCCHCIRAKELMDKGQEKMADEIKLYQMQLYRHLVDFIHLRTRPAYKDGNQQSCENVGGVRVTSKVLAATF